ncbi:hypothetical protein NEFER03_2255 [Nematocida sp. LUAm3]|nr:hypothetical protein NEFER03_2255 [Nematocida sp. LUAm3]KAI5175860.1 hypothetical protein NEFER02_1729 [Nematocida sp. LUAm2]KAI5179404.1 hypothetical protein NEFER01_2228 [Nematocida sp. LUAm1]
MKSLKTYLKVTLVFLIGSICYAASIDALIISKTIDVNPDNKLQGANNLVPVNVTIQKDLSQYNINIFIKNSDTKLIQKFSKWNICYRLVNNGKRTVVKSQHILNVCRPNPNKPTTYGMSWFFTEYIEEEIEDIEFLVLSYSQDSNSQLHRSSKGASMPSSSNSQSSGSSKVAPMHSSKGKASNDITDEKIKNTCYLSTAIYTLYNFEELRNCLYASFEKSKNNLNKMGDSLLSALVLAFHDISASDRPNNITTIQFEYCKLLTILGELNLKYNQQEDVVECIQKLIERIVNYYKEKKDINAIEMLERNFCLKYIATDPNADILSEQSHFINSNDTIIYIQSTDVYSLNDEYQSNPLSIQKILSNKLRKKAILASRYTDIKGKEHEVYTKESIYPIVPNYLFVSPPNEPIGEYENAVMDFNIPLNETLQIIRYGNIRNNSKNCLIEIKKEYNLKQIIINSVGIDRNSGHIYTYIKSANGWYMFNDGEKTQIHGNILDTIRHKGIITLLVYKCK